MRNLLAETVAVVTGLDGVRKLMENVETHQQLLAMIAKWTFQVKGQHTTKSSVLGSNSWGGLWPSCSAWGVPRNF